MIHKIGNLLIDLCNEIEGPLKAHDSPVNFRPEASFYCGTMSI